MTDHSEEPARVAPGRALSAKMSTLARRDTKPEVALRQALHKRGLRYRVQLKVPGNRRRTIDIAFTRARLAVYVDGCFWHGCPQHHVLPRANSDWWQWKVDLNRARDASTNADLREAGWQVLRIWEHTDPEEAADSVARAYSARVRAPERIPSGPR
jgi:DNA mismatch endonuclease (patch repair protein)